MNEKNRTILFWTSIAILVGIFVGGGALIVQARLPQGGVELPATPDFQIDKLKELFNSYE